MTSRAYRTRRRPDRTRQTRERIMAGVRELLAEGTFHEAPVEEVAERAGVSRATLYQHFRSRVELVDAICETFGENPALRQLRDTVELPDAEAALAETIALTVRFWASEDASTAPPRSIPPPRRSSTGSAPTAEANTSGSSAPSTVPSDYESVSPAGRHSRSCLSSPATTPTVSSATQA
jgi:AcrR family transcriptional regulator